MIAIDNAIELTIQTYLGLPKRVTGLKIRRKEFAEMSERASPPSSTGSSGMRTTSWQASISVRSSGFTVCGMSCTTKVTA
jgi:hypothetical protein